ncbi:MAG: metal-dependent hydrolase [Promethearchaeota archaeon]
MDFFTHFLIAVLVGNLLLKELNFSYIVFIGIMAIFPDLDIFVEPLKRIWHTYYILHRGASHSYFAGIFISAIAAAIFSFFTGNFFFEAWLIGYLAFSLHISLDFYTTSKVPALFPFKRKEYRLIADRAINPFVMFPSMIVFVFFIFRFLNLPWAYLFTNFANLYLILYISYFGYKLILKFKIQTSLPKNHHYIPGMLPFNYTIYENYEIENEQVYLLSKKSVFSSNKTTLFDVHINNDSKDMQYLNKALEISKKYRFFSKWEAMIPLIKEDGDNVIIILFLAESFSSDRCYQVDILIDNETGNVINEIDGFYKLTDFNLIQELLGNN